MATIAWLGLGNMGAPMAANLVAAGHDVRGFDPSPEAAAAAVAGGVVQAASAAEAVSDADAVITMLPRGEHVLAAYSGEDGVLALARPDAVLIDSSTIDVDTATELHRLTAERSLTFVDAPVSGGVSGATAGTLTFMVGGADEAVAAVRPYLEPMAGNIIPTGGPGTGQAAKICNNLILFINLVATSEGAVLADRLGLDKQVFWDIASVSTGNSWALRTWYPIPGVVPTAASNNDFAPTFAVDLANKDIKLALAAAESTKTPLALGSRVSEMLSELSESGLGGKDCSIMVKLVDETLERTV